jgi:hypothetical protein
MSAAVRLRGDFDADRLRALARGSKDGPQARRLLALAAIYEGAPRSEAARIGGVTLQIVRDWVLRFNAHGPDGLLDRKAPGPASLMQDTHRTALAGIVEDGPIAAVRSLLSMALCAGGSSISANGCSRRSGCLSPKRP